MDIACPFSLSLVGLYEIGLGIVIHRKRRLGFPTTIALEALCLLFKKDKVWQRVFQDFVRSPMGLHMSDIRPRYAGGITGYLQLHMIRISMRCGVSHEVTKNHASLENTSKNR